MSGSPGSRRRRRRLLGVLPVLALAALAWLNRGCTGPLRVEPLQAHTAPLTTDRHLELARTYAPWILKAVDPEEGRQDLPTRVDFDGNLRGDDNWEHMPRWALPPVVYYAALETETHWFLSYHLFHPRDWSAVRIGVHLTHENDGENLQVVVAKDTGRVVLLWTQAHYFGYAYAEPGSGVADGPGEDLEGRLLLVDEQGRPDPAGRRAAVYVEPGGHGIYGALDSASGARVAADGSVRFDDHGLVLRPARPGEAAPEPPLDAADPVPYRLESLTAKLWPGVRDGSLLGEGGLLDGTCAYSGRLGTFPVPRYYEGDRFSGPFGPDRGIAPFALGFSFSCGDVGALFYDPAARYAEVLTVPAPWSLDYVDYPFEPARGAD